MAIGGALQIGRSALTASQLAIQVAGNNLANAATVGYSRQTAVLAPSRGDGRQGMQVGTGVDVRAIRRQVDQALQSRLNSGYGAEAASQQNLSLLSSLESTLGELSGADLSTNLSRFFNVWSERANLVQSGSVVVQQGQTIAGFIQRVRSDLDAQRAQVDRTLSANAQTASSYLDQIARLNGSISASEVGGSTANSLRDQRDLLISELNRLMDVTAVEQPGGAVNVLVGSTPVVLGAQNRGVELRRETVDGELRVSVRVKEDGEILDVTSGAIGAALASRTRDIDATVATLDNISAQLIFQINRLHSTGANAEWYRSADGTTPVVPEDRDRAINDPANTTFAQLPFNVVNGGFFVNVRQNAAGTTQTVRINVDLDGINAAGLPGTGDDTSVADIAAALDNIAGVTARIGPNGNLEIRAEDGFQFSFSDDSSGALAALGVNSFFTGTDSSTIAVRQDLLSDPSRLAVGRIVNGQFVANGTALRIAQVQDQSIAQLGGQTIRSAWLGAVQDIGSRTDAARTAAEATTIVRESLEAQRAAVSGVSVDEEALNLMTFQRQFQGAAKFLTTIDEMTQTLINII